ncbi:LOW QUALITY PROTEIN: endoplasmic reticulum junction formation protein lunapark-B-like [Pseudochaenichthys georgianus]|uniref:LOW QUALITY PROTEIN: endoplasmic reticulum junction formation protein lunapark-B-like n=1 Tax=Pseudochaenichthys georgianus TaxID=52239 RepID=UPI00146C70A9|nr:LOW QUALITY PROTEIN: endoplasmic reticulum junction formation protein lunapark-B-like [Pseudochaenichthys georgianus]
MGALISRWRTKPTTVEQLENHEKEIKELEEFRAKNQRLQKLWVGQLILYSSVFYLLTSLVVYCLYLPEQWFQRIVMAVPFFIYPVLVWFIRRLLVFLFSKRTERNNDKLEELKASKKKILEEVMETETYKNAKLILERFDPEAKRKAELESTPVRPQMTPRPGQEIRQRGVPMRLMGTPIAMAMTPQPGARLQMGPGGTPVAPGGPPERSALSASVLQGSPSRTPYSPIPGVGMHPPGPPLARPILPKDRGAVDRVIEYLVGDGPQNRYALICQQCFSHNGMALREEFEYLAFRCAYCYFLNPARKTRPQAPRLPEFSYERRLRAESRSPGPAPRSPSDTEERAPPSGAKAPWSSVHSFHIQPSPKNPQNRPLQSPDEREMTEEVRATKQDEEGESQSEEQLPQEEEEQQQQQQEEEEQQQQQEVVEEVVQEKEGEIRAESQRPL